MNLENKLDCFNPGKEWYDTDGKIIQAHGGGILYHKGIYYWYGEDKNGDTISGDEVVCGYRVNVIGIHCYSSTDLYNWKDEGLVLSSDRSDIDHELHTSRVVERPKVIYNEKTEKFVMWMHIDKQDYGYAQSGRAESDSPAGPFKYKGSIKPNENDCRDMTLFKDEDGRAYLIHSSEWNKTLYFSELTEDYMNVTGKYKRAFIDCSREAPAVFKFEGKYYIISSGCTGWDPNVAEYAVSDSIMGEWEVKGNPCVGEDSDKTYYAQSTFVIKVEGKENVFIAMFDQWKKENLRDSPYVWLPIQITNGSIKIEWLGSWDLSVFN